MKMDIVDQTLASITSRRQDAANVTPNSDGISHPVKVGSRIGFISLTRVGGTICNLKDFNLVFCCNAVCIVLVHTYSTHASESTTLSFTDMPP